jgi:hypothetical protein
VRLGTEADAVRLGTWIAIQIKTEDDEKFTEENAYLGAARASMKRIRS